MQAGALLVKRPQLSLRDLFWLVLVAAIAVGWLVDHQGAREKLRRLSMHWQFGEPSGRIKPSAESQARTQLMHELNQLSDSQLSDRLGELLNEASNYRGPEYEPCLVEMALRRMHKELQSHYDQLMTPTERDRLFRYPGNRQLLTALRRAQGQPDPLKIQVDLWGQDHLGNSSSVPRIRTAIENVDVGKEFTYYVVTAGDHNALQIQMTNADGQRCSASNYSQDRRLLLRYQGVREFFAETLEYGERERHPRVLDVRHYVKAPSPGKYQLQVFCHDGTIANEPNLDGLIVLKSEPIDVIVEWPDGADPDVSFIPPLAVLGAVAAIVAWLIVRRIVKARGGKVAPLLRWRDLAWLALVMVLASGWLVDNRRQTAEILRLTPDVEANWTMRLAE